MAGQLNTGDVVLFRHNWRAMLVRVLRGARVGARVAHVARARRAQPLGGITALFALGRFDAHYDHVGVVVASRSGEPGVLEWTPSGVKVRWCL